MRDQKVNFGIIKKQIIAEILESYKHTRATPLKDHIKAIDSFSSTEELFTHISSNEILSFINLEKYHKIIIKFYIFLNQLALMMDTKKVLLIK